MYISRFKEIKMQHVVWEVIAYIIFLYLLMMIAYSNRDLLFYRLHNHYTKMFLKGTMDGSKMYDFWDLHKVNYAHPVLNTEPHLRLLFYILNLTSLNILHQNVILHK